MPWTIEKLFLLGGEGMRTGGGWARWRKPDEEGARQERPLAATWQLLLRVPEIKVKGHAFIGRMVF